MNPNAIKMCLSHINLLYVYYRVCKKAAMLFFTKKVSSFRSGATQPRLHLLIHFKLIFPVTSTA